MKTSSFIIAAAVVLIFTRFADATQADDTTITITGQTAGTTPFINQLSLNASDASVIKSIRFTITPKAGSVTRPLSATYSNAYLVARGDILPGSGQIFLPIYGLYANYTNTVTLTYYFFDGSSKEDATTIVTTAFDDPCGYESPTVLQARTDTTALSYDYIMIKGACSTFSPAIVDTDGTLRWVGTTGLSTFTATFFDNAAYLAHGTTLYRNDLDGTFSLIGDYSSIGVADFHHNIDRGKVGLLLEADTASQVESVVIEVDSTGNFLKRWDMADIISQAMLAGGDDPTQFVYAAPTDWFHNNAVTYNRADNSLIVSSREDFLLCIDYDTSTIKWILGDPTKKWYDFPSLRQYAISLPAGSLPPVGQHAVSITYDQGVLLFDNGEMSLFQMPPGTQRTYASPRKYSLDLVNGLATEVWNYPMSESVLSPFCGSVYEDAPLNYLVDYAFVNGTTSNPTYGQLLGLNAAGERVFYYQYPTTACNTAFNSIPLHLETTGFPAVGPQALNLSSRGKVASGDNALIGGFIITGIGPKTVVLRAIGPSLGDSGLTNVLQDPVLTLYDSSGKVVALNDDWRTNTGAGFFVANGLAPTNTAESAILENLSPGTYTAVVTGKGSDSGVALVEAYDLSPLSDAKLANISTRGFVESGENVLIGGFIVGDVANTTVIVRALGPSLTSAGVTEPLADPTLTIYDTNGVPIASNDNWQTDVSAPDIQADGLAPSDAAESATALFLPPGPYSAIVQGANGGSGVGLVEVYSIQ